jgi:hypothetical protein
MRKSIIINRRVFPVVDGILAFAGMTNRSKGLSVPRMNFESYLLIARICGMGC